MTETIYKYECKICKKILITRVSSLSKRTICRQCYSDTVLKIPAYKFTGTLENPNIGDIRYGKEIKPGNINRKYNKYIYCECEICKNKRWATLKHGKPESKRCNKCKWVGRKGSKSPLWKKKYKSLFRGYVVIHLDRTDPYYSMCSSHSLVFEHRLVVAQSLGRPLKAWEIVHHKNHIKTDNRLENLQLVSDDQHKSLTLLEQKIERLETKIKILEFRVNELEFENKTLKDKVI